MLKTIRPAIVMIVLMTALTGIAYPFAVTGIAEAIFPGKANGSLIERNGQIVGSGLIGQAFAAPGYFQPRPSATLGPDPADAAKTAAQPYNGANSMGSNASPTAKTLIDRVQTSVADYRQANGNGAGAVPADAVTTSASGLDPHISPGNAETQVARVAAARNLPADRVRQLVKSATEDRTLGFLGEPRVNVLLLNLSLDREQGGAQPGAVARQ
jgi:potassium-transporting ATPase KdpC subunit